MRTRNRIYAEILCFGLSSLREAAHLGQTELCAVEADHLHNIPTLLDDDNEARHVYYIQTEVKLYIDRLSQMRTQPSGFTRARYEDLWAELREHRGSSCS